MRTVHQTISTFHSCADSRKLSGLCMILADSSSSPHIVNLYYQSIDIYFSVDLSTMGLGDFKERNLLLALFLSHKWRLQTKTMFLAVIGATRGKGN